MKSWTAFTCVNCKKKTHCINRELKLILVSKDMEVCDIETILVCVTRTLIISFILKGVILNVTVVSLSCKLSRLHTLTWELSYTRSMIIIVIIMMMIMIVFLEHLSCGTCSIALKKSANTKMQNTCV